MTAPPDITDRTVAALLGEQFPDLAALPVRAVEPDGWDNRSFRVGADLVARLPSAKGYVPQVAKEAAWLPWLATRLPFSIPEIVGVGAPGCGYPFPWTLRRWIPGAPLCVARVSQHELTRFVVRFLSELWSLPTDGPEPGEHSAFRGGPVTRFSDEVADALRGLPSTAERGRAARVWADAVDASHREPDTRWFHGDLAAGNLLVQGERITAVIDFGCAGVGDAACDLAFCWTDLDAPSRAAVRQQLGIAEDLWHRGRGWALWKSLITLHEPGRAEASGRTLRELGVLD